MATVHMDKRSKLHIAERASKRYPAYRDLTMEEIFEQLSRIRGVLQRQAPDDWRFTCNPAAVFIVSDQDTSLKVLGRSYRDCGREIMAEIKGICGGRVKSAEGTSLIDELVCEYIMALCNGEALIIHELKTCPKKEQAVSQDKDTYEAIKGSVPHLIPIKAKRWAVRPNAMIDKGRLWVRQNEWSNTKDDNEYFLFQLLSPKGIDKSCSRIYLYKGGLLELQEEQVEQDCPRPIFLRSGFRPPETAPRYRTESYWTVPTYPDCFMMDLNYKRGAAPLGISPKEASMLLLWQEVQLRAREQF